VAAEIAGSTVLYEGWTKLLGVRVRLEGGEEVRREVEDHGRAVAVLPYDPRRRTVVLVRLLRVPVLLAGGAPELVEAIAGMVDDEDPADAARREADEEAGLRLGALEPVGSVWTSPGVSTERMDLFLAAYSEQDRVGPGGGNASEHENITVLEVPLDEAWGMLERGQIADMKTMTLLLLLKTRHPGLFLARSITSD
jgi:nudix-type nucleoside diphosphatase (YffH/AdpP family)